MPLRYNSSRRFEGRSPGTKEGYHGPIHHRGAPSILGLTAVSALLGFSERLLTRLNERVPTSR